MNFQKLLSVVTKNDDYRYKLQYVVTITMLGIVSLVMTIVNITTKQSLLTIVTAAFTLLSVLNIILIRASNVTYKIARVLFAVEIIALFTYFIISGQPQGFSVIWTLMLPSLGLLLFGFKTGTMLTTIMFLIIVSCFWIPGGQNILLYDYSETFMLRFPFAYIAFYFVGLLFEIMRSKTFDNYHYSYIHDSLTGAFNRIGYSEHMEAIDRHNTYRVEYVMIDIDEFKKINDTYGHPCGDIVLKEVVHVIETTLGVPICRFGGEEFFVYFPNAEKSREDLEKLLKAVEHNVVTYDDKNISVTISVGAIIIDRDLIDEGNDPLKLADDCLYQAKNSGRNCIVFSTIE